MERRGTATWEGLYGPSAESAPTPPTAQVQTIRVARGFTPTAPYQLPFPAYSVTIDNATGRWWRLNGRWIPPWVIGAVLPLQPPASQLTVERLTPAGLESDQVGVELVIIASSEPSEQHDGLYLAQGTAENFLSDTPLVSETNNVVSTIYSPVAGQNIRPIEVWLAAEIQGSAAGGRRTLRTMCTLQLEDDDAGVHARLAISPEQPADRTSDIRRWAAVDAVVLRIDLANGGGEVEVAWGFRYQLLDSV